MLKHCCQRSAKSILKFFTKLNNFITSAAFTNVWSLVVFKTAVDFRIVTTCFWPFQLHSIVYGLNSGETAFTASFICLNRNVCGAKKVRIASFFSMFTLIIWGEKE